MEDRSQSDNMYKVLEGNICEAIILYSAKLSIKNEGEIKTFISNKKLSKFIIRELDIQEILKGVFKAELKGHERVT